MNLIHIRSLAVACALAVSAFIVPAAAQTRDNAGTTTTIGTPLNQYMAVAWEGEGYLITENGGKNWRLVYGNALSTLPEPIIQILKYGTSSVASMQATAMPNPTTGPVDLRFAVNRPGNVTIALHDAQGGEVLRHQKETAYAGLHTHNIDVSSLPSGVYYYRLISGADHIGSGTVTVVR